MHLHGPTQQEEEKQEEEERWFIKRQGRIYVKASSVHPTAQTPEAVEWEDGTQDHTCPQVVSPLQSGPSKILWQSFPLPYIDPGSRIETGPDDNDPVVQALQRLSFTVEMAGLVNITIADSWETQTDDGSIKSEIPELVSQGQDVMSDNDSLSRLPPLLWSKPSNICQTVTAMMNLAPCQNCMTMTAMARPHGLCQVHPRVPSKVQAWGNPH